jgi:hypothetical protein
VRADRPAGPAPMIATLPSPASGVHPSQRSVPPSSAFHPWRAEILNLAQHGPHREPPGRAVRNESFRRPDGDGPIV